MVEEHPSYAGSQKDFVSWRRYGKMLHELASTIPQGKYSAVCGVPRGGAVVAVYLSHALDVPCVSAPNDDPNVLVCDDLTDTGETLSGVTHDIAVLFHKPWSTVAPTYFVEETEAWIVFPYETEEWKNETRE